MGGPCAQCGKEESKMTMNVRQVLDLQENAVDYRNFSALGYLGLLRYGPPCGSAIIGKKYVEVS
jgi:hypothetical protein